MSIAMQLVEVGWKDRFALGIFWEKPMCKTAVAVDCLAKFIKAAGLPVIVDRAVGLEPRLRPGDITLPRWHGVSPLYVDITIFHIPLRCLLTGISCTQAWRISQRRKESSA